jgi:hypothetical protein
MGEAAVALAVLGFAVGLVFRLKVLLPILAVLLIGSLIFSLERGFSFLEAAATIMVAQSIVQGSYFLGLLVRAFFFPNHRMRPVI